MKHLSRHLRPGGQIEIAEVRTWLWCGDDSFPKDCHTNRMQAREALPVGDKAVLTLS